MRTVPPSRSLLAALRAAPSFAPVRWVLTTMAMAMGLAMMFGVRPTEAFPTAAAAVATPATAADADAAQASTTTVVVAARDGREDARGERAREQR